MVLLICSDGECEAIYEAWGDPAELEALACDCGCTLQIVRFTEEEAPVSGVELQYVGG